METPWQQVVAPRRVTVGRIEPQRQPVQRGAHAIRNLAPSTRRLGNPGGIAGRRLDLHPQINSKSTYALRKPEGGLAGASGLVETAEGKYSHATLARWQQPRSERRRVVTGRPRRGFMALYWVAVYTM